MAGKAKSGHDLDQELIELLNELRVALPGVQVLFAFLLVVPFNQGWAKVDGIGQTAYFLALAATTIASVLFIAPTAHHRLEWRERDKEWLLQIANRLSIAATGFLAVAMTSAVFFITQYVLGTGAGIVGAVATGALFFVIWYLLPLLRKAKT